jgi:hypothetical protein
MGTHHTKDKGDLGVAKAHADLVEQGLMVLFPATEHAPFDLVAYDGVTFERIQVKYRTRTGDVIKLGLRSVWSDRHGVHRKPFERTSVDVVCIYCPDTDECYYVRPDTAQHLTLRFTPSLNCQSVGVRLASDYRLFQPQPAADALLMTEVTAIPRPRPR